MIVVMGWDGSKLPQEDAPEELASEGMAATEGFRFNPFEEALKQWEADIAKAATPDDPAPAPLPEDKVRGRQREAVTRVAAQVDRLLCRWISSHPDAIAVDLANYRGAYGESNALALYLIARIGDDAQWEGHLPDVEIYARCRGVVVQSDTWEMVIPYPQMVAEWYASFKGGRYPFLVTDYPKW